MFGRLLRLAACPNQAFKQPEASNRQRVGGCSTDTQCDNALNTRSPSSYVTLSPKEVKQSLRDYDEQHDEALKLERRRGRHDDRRSIKLGRQSGVSRASVPMIRRHQYGFTPREHRRVTRRLVAHDKLCLLLSARHPPTSKAPGPGPQSWRHQAELDRRRATSPHC